MTRSSRLLIYGMGIIFALILLQKAFIMYTDYLWYQSLGQVLVFTKILGTRCVLGLLVGGVFFAWLYSNLRYARKPLPSDLKLIGKRLLPEEEREQIEAYADKALLVFAVTGAVMAGIVASGRWLQWMQLRNGGSFGETDALFGKDLGFYVFDLSFLNFVWQSLFFAVVITFISAAIVHIYQESVRLVGNTVHAVPQAKTHLLGLLGLALLVKAYAYRLAQYNLLYSSRGEEFFGPSYADVHGRLPVLYVLIAVALVAGLVMFVSTRLRSLNVPIGALAAVLIISLLGGWIYPAALQQFVVKPNQLTMESKYISNNIKATLKAYGLDTIRAERHVVRENLDQQAIRNNRATIDNIRLWDHRPLETTFQQTQALRSYYRFTDVDVDRYMVNGQERQVMLAGRLLDRTGLVRPTWVNQHLLYTHGYGLCLAPVNEIVGDGLPNYWVKDFPPQSTAPELAVSRPQLYYYTSRHPRLIEYISPQERPHEPVQPTQPAAGPGGPPEPGAPGPAAQEPAAPSSPAGPGTFGPDVPYVIVNTKEAEFDYPRGDEATVAGAATEQYNATTKYAGKGDVQLSSFFRRFCFFMRFRHPQIMLTTSITPESRILFNRGLPERLMTVAPIMGYDPDPYLVINKGQLKWISDAYTATNMYPYSARVPWFGANYVRNSVKVVTDAYDGVPEFYVMPTLPGQKPDPVIECWQRVFPTLFKDYAQMDEGLKKHLRYPQLMFRIQAEIYAKYHMENPQTFFQKEDMWAIPPEVYGKGRRDVESFYVNMKLPTEKQGGEEFLLMQPFALARREDKNMVSWMAARCDAPNYGQLIVYEFPKTALVQGPMQVESRITQDADISQLITLWGQEGSDIIRGNLLVIPVDDALLYVEPFYLQAQNNPLPQLKLVVLAYDDRIVNAPTLNGALNKLFGEGTAQATAAETEVTLSATGSMPSANLKQLLQQAVALDAEAQKAMAQGDLATYQAKQRQQQQLIQRALQMAK
ncbi:MAG: UPF0182 family protein [Armatimonadia bacterium]